MKVFIVSDMEGVAGIVKWQQTSGGHAMYEEGRRLYTGEINAALCGTWGCPVLLVTGDEASCREGRELLGDGLTTVAVKKGLGRFSARQLPAQAARERIEAGTKKALENLSAVEPYDPGKPCEITVDFNTSDHVEKLRFRPGVEITEPRQIVSRADDWWSAWQQFYF